MAMAGMESISEAVLNKVGAEAGDIIKDAERQAGEMIKRAEAERERKLEEQRRRLIGEAEAEAARMRAQASIRARQEILAAKASVIESIVGRVKREVVETASTKGSLLGLINEAVRALGGERVRLYVSKADVEAVRSLQKENEDLGKSVVDVQELPITGGIIAENEEGTIRIDNAYETRLDILLPRILPEVGRELFEAR